MFSPLEESPRWLEEEWMQSRRGRIKDSDLRTCSGSDSDLLLLLLLLSFLSSISHVNLSLQSAAFLFLWSYQSFRSVCHFCCMLRSSCSGNVFFFFTYLVLPNFPVSLVPIWLLVGLTRPLESFKFSSLTHELSFSSGLDFVIVTCYLSWRVLPRRWLSLIAVIHWCIFWIPLPVNFLLSAAECFSGPEFWW